MIEIGKVYRVGDTQAYCRVDEIKGNTAKVYFGRDCGGAYFDRVSVDVLRETERDSYGLPQWLFKSGVIVDKDGNMAELISVGRTYAELVINGNTTNVKKIEVVMRYHPSDDDVTPFEEIDEDEPKVTPKVATPSQTDFSAALAPLFSGVGDLVTQQVMAKVAPVLKEIRDKAPVRHIHVIRKPDGKEIEKEEIFHPLFDKISTLIQFGEPIYIYGPAGTGKTHFARQLAEALDMDFYFVDKVTDESELVGYPNIKGEHVPTPFTEWYIHGGLLLFDEMDRSEEQCLVRVNSALANGYCNFPVLGNVKMNPNCRVIGAGNTSGRGATEAYNTAHQLDESTINRFFYSLYFDYCDELDLYSANGDKELAQFAKDFRQATEKANIVCTCSYRNIKAIANVMSLDYSIAESLDLALFKGMDMDAKRCISKNLKANNKYSSYCRTL